MSCSLSITLGKLVCCCDSMLLCIHCPSCWWCAAHLHSQSTTDKPNQDEGASLAPDISLLSPELQQQWHVERNMHLGPIKVKPYSETLALWQCNKCSAGQPHIWSAEVHRRSHGSQCPYCCNRLVCAHNSLAAKAPDLAKYWNQSKNETAPHQVLAGSNVRAHWKCPACKWEWQAPIRSRVHAAAGCPQCSPVLHATQRQPTFAAAQPACLAEWDYERNQVEGFHPDVITLGSGKLVHWICSRCPKGQPHRWTAVPYDRIGKGVGCAVCAGKQACVCNSLESLFPAIAAEFDVDKNGFAASKITAQSHMKVWWRNAERGSWRAAVYIRTAKGRSRNQQV